ncbi:unnamed protein product [Effrenium voratum]|nr:unnamed protein product [Effrenium voratum]
MTHSKCLATGAQIAAYAALMPHSPAPIQVMCGLQGSLLCQVVPKASWTLQDLLDAVSLETQIPGDDFRLVWGGVALAPGPLPFMLLRKSDVPLSLTLVRVNPAWVAALDRVLASLVPELPSFTALVEQPGQIDLGGDVRGRFAENRDLALAAVQHSGSFLMHCPEELLQDKDAWDVAWDGSCWLHMCWRNSTI